jgi:hypothetical protein
MSGVSNRKEPHRRYLSNRCKAEHYLRVEPSFTGCAKTQQERQEVSGHDFSRAESVVQEDRALAPEGRSLPTSPASQTTKPTRSIPSKKTSPVLPIITCFGRTMESWWSKKAQLARAGGQLVDFRYFDFKPFKMIDLARAPSLTPMKTRNLLKKYRGEWGRCAVVQAVMTCECHPTPHSGAKRASPGAPVPRLWGPGRGSSRCKRIASVCLTAGGYPNSCDRAHATAHGQRRCLHTRITG